MKTLRHLILIPAITIFMISCNSNPDPIRYGEESCSFCEMTIVSQAHSAQAVSTKGKQFKYDAIECMVNDVIQKETEMAVKQVANFHQPGEMIEVQNARFIINDSINSPMGANLAAVKRQANVPGEMLTWDELKTKFLGEDTVSSNH